MQEPLLTLHAAQDYATYVAFYKASFSRWVGVIAFAMLSVLCLLGAVLTGDVAPLILSLGFALLAVFWMYYAIAQPNLRKLKKQLEEKPSSSEIFKFFEEHVQLDTQSELVKNAAALQYGYYVSAWELPTFFTLNPPAGGIILFAKRDMTEEQQQTLRELFSRKYADKFTIRKHVPSKIK